MSTSSVSYFMKLLCGITHPFVIPCHDPSAYLVGCEYRNLADEMVVCCCERHPSTEGEESWKHKQSRFEASGITSLPMMSDL